MLTNNLYFRKRNGLKHELLRNEDNIAETRIEVSFVYYFIQQVAT